MNESADAPLLVGEILIDFTVTQSGTENKLRLGGVAHAARGFWALGIQFRAAVFLPSYLEEIARRYFEKLGCLDFEVIGTVVGAPNVTVIFDATEVADQGYDDLLRDEKVVAVTRSSGEKIRAEHGLIFPGRYPLIEACDLLSSGTRLHIDVAYDVHDASLLERLEQRIETIFISTSSKLFMSVQQDGLNGVLQAFSKINPSVVILKENRGGSRLVFSRGGEMVPLPAQLGTTINSVGVGDVFDAAYIAYLNRGHVEAGWRATYAGAAYSQTTEPDQFKIYVARDKKLSLQEMTELWGVYLPWERRRDRPIYLAAPDFAGANRVAIDRALQALSYHNFNVRRPVIENGELPPNAGEGLLKQTYRADYDLLKACSLVFAVPTGRDPGTLVELGIAIEASIPVIVFDPIRECANTMVIAGASFYSTDLDLCVNATFKLLGEPRPVP